MRMKSIMIRFFLFFTLFLSVTVLSDDPSQIHEGEVVKGNRNAIYLVKDGKKHLFPDFHTFISMGFNQSSVKKIPDITLDSISLGDRVPKIAAPPPFRPDDYMYHYQCEDPERMVNLQLSVVEKLFPDLSLECLLFVQVSDLGVVSGLGDFNRYIQALDRILTSKHMDILTLGGSITAGGYMMEYKRLLKEKSNIDVTIHNHGHGATEITCKWLSTVLSLLFY